MNRKRSGASWHRVSLLPAGGVCALVLLLLMATTGTGQTIIEQSIHQPLFSVPERFALPDHPLTPEEIDEVSKQIRSAADYLFDRVQPKDWNVLQRGPHHWPSGEAHALQALKNWLETAGCVNKASVPLLTSTEPSAFVLRTSYPGQIPMSVNYRLVGEGSQTVQYAIWLAPGPGLRHIDLTWEH